MESTQLGKDRQDSSRRRRSLIEDSCIVLNTEGTLWRESRSSVAGDTANRYKTIPSHHKWSSGSPSTLHTPYKLIITLSTSIH